MIEVVMLLDSLNLFFVKYNVGLNNVFRGNFVNLLVVFVILVMNFGMSIEVLLLLEVWILGIWDGFLFMGVF